MLRHIYVDPSKAKYLKIKQATYGFNIVGCHALFGVQFCVHTTPYDVISPVAMMTVIMPVMFCLNPVWQSPYYKLPNVEMAEPTEKWQCAKIEIRQESSANRSTTTMPSATKRGILLDVQSNFPLSFSPIRISDFRFLFLFPFRYKFEHFRS